MVLGGARFEERDIENDGGRTNKDEKDCSGGFRAGCMLSFCAVGVVWGLIFCAVGSRGVDRAALSVGGRTREYACL